MQTISLSLSITAFLLSTAAITLSVVVFIQLKIRQISGAPNLHFLSADQLGMEEKEMDRILNQDLDELD